MKKLFSTLTLSIGIFLSGCSISVDDVESVSNKIEDKANELGSTVDDAIAEMDRLADKNKLSSKDQSLIVDQIKEVSAAMDEFKDFKTPVMKKAKKFLDEKLAERQDILADIQKKAEEGEATIKDVKKIRDTLQNDLEIKIFN